MPVRRHPHEIPMTNCYQSFIDIRKHISKKHRALFPVKPKLFHGFDNYLMNKQNYTLLKNAWDRLGCRPAQPPDSVPVRMRPLFVQQEEERLKLKLKHTCEREKLVLSVEQEILRVHGLAARSAVNQLEPFSFCAFMKDQEVYSIPTPEQEEKEKNSHPRYNGRLFLSWLQDVDDKWEKIKEDTLNRHKLELVSLQARQRLEWALKFTDFGLPCEDFPPRIPDSHVPLINTYD